MTVALREILRLWLRQKRHDFHWQDIFMTVYFGGIYIAVVIGLYAGFRDQLTDLPQVSKLVMGIPVVAMSIQLGDLMMKLFWRRSPVEMDDYLRTRPVAPGDWSLFVLIETSQSIMQWMFALMIAFAAAFVLPWWAVLTALLLTFSVSLTNALFQNCWRRAPGNEWTLPLVFGYLVWMGIAWAVALSAFFFGYASSVALLVVNAAVCYVLHRYFTRMKNHNEEMHAPVSTKVHSFGEASLWSIEWVQVLRSKRLRVSFFLIVAIFLLNTYLQQMSFNTIEKDFSLGVNPMLLFGIAFPSIILAQWVLGIEANFFSGIWTKPWPVEGILQRKFLFFCAICGMMALLILPCVFWMNMSIWAWLASLTFGCGFFVLPFMASCLFSSRMDLFASAFFNYQGGNKQLSAFSFIMFIPMGIYFAAYFLLPGWQAHLLIGGLGVLGLALHRPYIHWIANVWHRRRYKIMERWLKE